MSVGLVGLAEHRPVRIAGAGPAGLACAIELAIAGVPVEVHEARSVVGGRFHGGHQILACFGPRPSSADVLETLGVRRDGFESTPLHSARFLSGTDAVVSSHSRLPYALLIRRGPGDGTLDAALAQRARTAGAILHLGSRLEPADADIVATGPSQVDGLALELTFQTDAPQRVDVLLDRQFLPDGYAYLFVCAGRGTLGVTTLSEYRELDDRLHEAVSRFGCVEPLALREPRAARAAMSFWIPRTANFAGRLYVGEAGGFQDYLYGLGLRAALLSGALAARALLSGDGYDRLWQAALRPRMRGSVVDRFLFEALPQGGARLLDTARGADLQRALERVHRDRIWKRLAYPWIAARWSRGKRSCKHGALPHWCRRTSGARPVDAAGTSGPVASAARERA